MGILKGLLGGSEELSVKELTADFKSLLFQEEIIEKGYKIDENYFILTDFRILMVDRQGVTGKKLEVHSLPYKNIIQFIIIVDEGNASGMAELKLYLAGSSGYVVKEFNKKIDIYDLQKRIAYHVLKG